MKKEYSTPWICISDLECRQMICNSSISYGEQIDDANEDILNFEQE